MASYTITAEHTQGKSVDPPLAEIVDAAEPCDCQRHLCPGGNAWWGSVAIHAEPRS